MAVARLGGRQKFVRPHCPGPTARWKDSTALSPPNRPRTRLDLAAERAAALPPWLEHYSMDRSHLGISGARPIDRVNNAARALHGAGRRVPQDVSVVGFDDLPESSEFLPLLTTVHQDFAEVGRRCVEQVLRQVREGAHATGTDLVPTRLVVRASTAGPSHPL